MLYGVENDEQKPNCQLWMSKCIKYIASQGRRINSKTDTEWRQGKGRGGMGRGREREKKRKYD